MKPFRAFVVATAAVMLAGGIAYTADQAILGRVMTLKDPSNRPNAGSVVGRGKEKHSPNTVVGDPTVGGATLSVFANGATASSQTFTLPAAGWIAAGPSAFKYKDASGTFGPVKRALIKRASNGSFIVRAVASAKNGPIVVAPPNPGTDGCIALAIAGGDTYHLKFGTDAKIKNKGAELFQAKRPATEGLCATGSTTTSTTVVTTSTSSTTSTTIYGSPSRAFLDAPSDLLD
jgi:hypothetical protein